MFFIAPDNAAIEIDVGVLAAESADDALHNLRRRSGSAE